MNDRSSRVDDSPKAGLHHSRAKEFVTGQALGVAVAMGSVWLARSVAPRQMDAATKAVAHWMKPGSNGYTYGRAREAVNVGLMLAGGLLTSIGLQAILARKRRSENGYDEHISVGQDISRLLTGWTVGALGATTAIYLARRYGVAESPHSVSDIVCEAERALDKYLLKGTELTPGNRISEGLVDNAIMIMGAAPVNIAAQQVFDRVTGRGHAIAK